MQTEKFSSEYHEQLLKIANLTFEAYRLAVKLEGFDQELIDAASDAHRMAWRRIEEYHGIAEEVVA